MNLSLNRLFFLGVLVLLILTAKSDAHSVKLDSLIKVSQNRALPDTQRVRVLISVYLLLEESEKYAIGKPYLDQALQLGLASGDHKSVADVKYCLGKYFLLFDNHPEALRMDLDALATYESENDDKGASKSLMYIGLINDAEKNYPEALSYFERAIQKSAAINFYQITFTCSYLKALTLTKNGELDKAYSILKMILDQPDSLLDDQRKMECLVGLGDVFAKRNLNDSAMYYYETAYDYCDKTENMSGIIHVGIKIANVKLNQNNTDDALRIALRCVHLYDSVQTSQTDILMGYKILSEVYFRKNNFKDAYLNLDSYYNLRDTLFNAENARKINNLQLAGKQQEIDIANKDIQKQAILKNAFIVGFILTLLLLIVSIRSVTVNRRKNQELKQSNFEVQQTLTQLQSTQEQLIKQEKLASLGQMVAGIAHEMQNPLNFVNNFSEVSVQLAKEYADASGEEREQLMVEIVENLIRIRDHGIRASAIVRSMLLYSRNSTFEKHQIDLKGMLTDFIPLAYEGLHAADSSFRCRIEKHFGQLPLVSCIPQDISRVFLNLLTNAFYAVNDKKKTSNEYYLPVVTVTTSVIKGAVKIQIHDNGNGIPDAIKEKIFEPFFTTKPAGKGTGLGLSLSYDIIKAHGGSLNVESMVDVFTEFNITLPV